MYCCTLDTVIDTVVDKTMSKSRIFYMFEYLKQFSV